jgi:hypothetical protein
LPVALLLDAYQYNASMYTALQPSQNRKYVVRAVVWRGSALDIDYAKVIVRRPYSPFSKTVYEGSWFGDEDGSVTPHLHWTDNTHLVVEVPGEYSSLNPCATSAGDIVIECRPQEKP